MYVLRMYSMYVLYLHVHTDTALRAESHQVQDLYLHELSHLEVVAD